MGADKNIGGLSLPRLSASIGGAKISYQKRNGCAFTAGRSRPRLSGYLTLR